MTETEKIEAKNGDSTLSDTEAKIIRQIEYYFGDFNLSKDKFLKDTIKADEGWVSMDTMLKFQRLSKISSDAKEILASLKKSESGLMEVDEENAKIRRRPTVPLPEEEDVKKEQAKMTIYVKGFEKEKTTLDDLLDFFSKYENVINVFKVKNPEGEELIRKWQEDYNEEKKNEFEEKKKKIHEHKAGAKKVKEMVKSTGDTASEAKKEEENLLPKGTVLKLENLNETTTREMLRETLEKEFGVTHTDIAFIYYSKGEPTASLRFKEENAAKNLLTKIEESLKTDGEDAAAKKFEVNGTEVKVSVLEGDEETTFLAKCQADMNENRGRNRGGGHKRRGGFQRGRGGKRSRH